MQSSRSLHVFAVIVFALAVVGWAGSSEAQGKAPERSESTAAATRPAVDVNSAGVDELVEVPGIGEATAKRIVAFRDEHGPFKTLDELMRVRGIGEKSLEKLRPHLALGRAGRSKS